MLCYSDCTHVAHASPLPGFSIVNVADAVVALESAGGATPAAAPAGVNVLLCAPSGPLQGFAGVLQSAGCSLLPTSACTPHRLSHTLSRAALRAPSPPALSLCVGSACSNVSDPLAGSVCPTPAALASTLNASAPPGLVAASAGPAQQQQPVVGLATLAAALQAYVARLAGGPVFLTSADVYDPSVFGAYRCSIPQAFR